MYNDNHRPRGHGHGRGPRDDFDGRERRGVPLSELDPAITDVSRRVIGSAIDVHKTLGPGYPVEVYLKALCSELEQAGVRFTLGHRFAVKYKGKEVGHTQPCTFIDDRFLVEVMAVHKEIGYVERATLRAQLRAGELQLGLIINFAERRLKDGLVRVLNPEKIASLREADHLGHDHADDGHDAPIDPDRPA
ncbi:MAG: GxxExxY protein [Phycisphaerales bacterium]